MTGVYKISSKLNPDMFYIGGSKNIASRWKFHLNSLKNKSHSNYLISAHVEKYGLNDLQFEIIEVCNLDKLRKLEHDFIHLMNPKLNDVNNKSNPQKNMYVKSLKWIMKQEPG